MPQTSDSFEARMAFVVELATHLHRYGTTAQRLEGAINAVSAKLDMHSEPWVNPTGLILAFRDLRAGAGALQQDDVTRVIRLGLGDVDLYRLVEADRIAEDVLAGTLDVAGGHRALVALQALRPRRFRWMQILAFALASASVAGMMRLPWLDIGTAGITGLLLAILLLNLPDTARAREVGDALAGMLAASVAVLVACFVGPLNLNSVIIAAVVVLLPGMMLTNAMNELTSQHLVSGSARFAGAIIVLIKLAVGVAIAWHGARMLGLQPQVEALRPQAGWVEATAVLLASLSFAILFNAPRRDFPVVMLAAILGYSISKLGAGYGVMTGIFLSALFLTAAGNAYSRWRNRPGALVRLPGIIMLVPGSIGLRGVLNLIQQQEMGAGESALMTLASVLFALIAGLLFGNVLLPTRRYL